MKRVCDKCHSLAVWNYLPGTGTRYFCEDCVPRGCSCMSNDDGKPETDKQGRELPCIDYDYSGKGFTIKL